MTRFILRHRALLDRLIRLTGAVAFLGTVAGAILLKNDDWNAQRFLLVYIAPLFLFGAMWARDRLSVLDTLAPSVAALDALAFAAGALRIAGGWGVLPYSGHMLFLSYAAATPGRPWLRLAALALIAMTTWFKLVLWHDPRSWLLGLVAGLALAVLRLVVTRRADHAHLVARPRTFR
jgi:hypothetical protein